MIFLIVLDVCIFIEQHVFIYPIFFCLCVTVQLTEWWMQSAYLDCRMPVAVYTSPGVVLPRMHFHDRQGQMR